MTSFMARSAKHFMVIKAAREIRKDIEQAGLDNLKVLANANISIIKTYLNGSSPEEKAKRRRDLNALLQMGVSPDMLLAEVARQQPDLAPIIESKQDYRKTEIQNLEQFLREG